MPSAHQARKRNARKDLDISPKSLDIAEFSDRVNIWHPTGKLLRRQIRDGEIELECGVCGVVRPVPLCLSRRGPRLRRLPDPAPTPPRPCRRDGPLPVSADRSPVHTSDVSDGQRNGKIFALRMREALAPPTS